MFSNLIKKLAHHGRTLFFRSSVNNGFKNHAYFLLWTMPLTSLQSELLLHSQLYLTLLSRNPSWLNLSILSLDLQPTWTISTLTFISPLFVPIICGCNLTIRGNRFDYCGLSDTQCGSMSSTHAAIHEAILRDIENGQCLKVTNRFLCLPSPPQRDTKITDWYRQHFKCLCQLLTIGIIL